MDQFDPSHEAFFEFTERPFSLTADPRYHFLSRSHSRAFEALSAGLGRGERLLQVSGDLGVGKTTLCRALVASLTARTRTALVADALLSSEDLLRLVLQDLGVVTKDDVKGGRLARANLLELIRLLDESLRRDGPDAHAAVVVVDEAHRLPATTARQIVAMTSRQMRGRPLLQIVLAVQPSVGGAPALPATLDQYVSTRARILALERDECERYLTHRLEVACGGAAITFDPRAIEAIHELSGGVPRLVNLIAERALREAATTRTRRVERSMVEAAAIALAVLRARPRRFRWFGSRAS